MTAASPKILLGFPLSFSCKATMIVSSFTNQRLRMSVKNALILFFITFIKRLQRKRAPISSSTHYLIVSTTALGDTMWATPAISALKHKDKGCTLSVLTSEVGSDVLSDNPYIDAIYIYKKPFLLSVFYLLVSLRKAAIDKVILLHTSQRAILPLCYLIGAREIVASKGMSKGLDSLLTKAVPLSHEHEIERRLRLVDGLHPDSDRQMHIAISSHHKHLALTYLTEKGLMKKPILIGMHPGAKDPFKRWPEECFIDLGKRLQASLDCSILITGSPKEKALTEKIASAIPGAVALTESLDVKTLGAIIEKLCLFITNDTGPMHIAYALKTPTVSLFTATDHTLCGPLHIKKASVIQKHKTCTPCLRKKCILPFCMLQISPYEVEMLSLKLYREQLP